MASWLKAESYRRGFALTSLLTLLTQLVGFAVISMIAHFFGTNIQTDLYLYMCSLSTMVAMYLAGILQAVALPEAMRRDAEKGRGESSRHLNTNIAVLVTLAALPSLFTFIRPELFLEYTSRYTAAQLAPHRELLRAAAPLFFLETLNLCLSLSCMSFRFFSVTGIASLAQRTIQAAFLTTGHEQLGVASLLYGTWVSHALNFAMLAWVMRRRLGWHVAISSGSLRGFLSRDVVATALSSLTTSLVFQIPAYLFTGLGQGIVTIFNYAARVQGLSHSLLLNPFSFTIGARFNAVAAENDPRKMNDVFRNAVSTVSLLMTPFAALLMLEAPWIIRLLFGHGTMTAQDTDEAARFLRAMSLALPFWGINATVWRLTMARQKMTGGSVFQVLQNVLMAGFFIAGARVGGNAALSIVYAGSVFMIWNAVALGLMLRWLCPDMNYWRSLSGFVLVAVATAAAAAIAMAVRRLCEPAPEIVAVAAAGIVFVAVLAMIVPRLRLGAEVDMQIQSAIGKIRAIARGRR